MTAKVVNRLRNSFVAGFLVVAPVSVSAETYFFAGSGSYAFHKPAFENYVDVLVDEYTEATGYIEGLPFSFIPAPETVEEKWGEFFQDAQMDVDYTIQDLARVGVGLSIDDLEFAKSITFDGRVSLTSAFYSFPNGISPYDDPATIEISALQLELGMNRRMALASFDRGSISLTPGLGLSAVASSTTFDNAMLNYTVRDLVLLPYANVAGKISYGRTAFELSGKYSSDAQTEITFALMFH